MTIHRDRRRFSAQSKNAASALALAVDLKAQGLIESINLPATKTVDQMAREAIDQYMQEHGARRFAPNDTADDFNLCVFLRWRGYRVQRNCALGSRRAPFFINDIAYTRKAFLAFVDAVRAALDLQPIGKPA